MNNNNNNNNNNVCLFVSFAAVGLNYRYGQITLLIIYMKKSVLDSDWSKTVQLLCNSVQKCAIPCRNL